MHREEISKKEPPVNYAVPKVGGQRIRKASAELQSRAVFGPKRKEGVKNRMIL